VKDNKQRLELTWIGKDKQPQLKPRILIEDAGKSYGGRGNVPNALIALLAFFQKHLAVAGRISYTVLNTRAVPLVRKDDAHQGRVFYFRLPSTCEEYGV